MRPLEILLLVVLSPSIVLLTVRSFSYNYIFYLFTLLPLGVGVWQLVVEGYRWQMLPAYSLAVGLLVYGLGPWMRGGRTPYAIAAAALACWIAALILSVVLPVFDFPVPTGPYKIGTQVRYLVDLNRLESSAKHKTIPRELMIQIWYPADAHFRGPVSRYREAVTTDFYTRQLSLVKTNTQLDAPISRAVDRYPVLIFSPSWSGQRVQNTFQAEELASHGFIVVGMDHTYGTNVTAFPDGRAVKSELGAAEDYSSQARFVEFVHTAEAEVRIRANDARFVLDKLEEFNQQDPQALLTARIDLDRVGIFGHSLGGSVAAQACWLDPRFKAGLDMDGMMVDESAVEGTTRPFFFMLEDVPLPPQSELSKLKPRSRRAAEFAYEQQEMMRHSLAMFGGFLLVIQGTTHKNYSDSPLFSPLKFLTGAGSIDARRAFRVINNYTLAFFERYLNGRREVLLEGPAEGYPEARIAIWKVPGLGQQNSQKQ